MAIKIVKRSPEAVPAQTAAAASVTEPTKAPTPTPTPTPKPAAEEAPKASPEPVQQPATQSILQALKIWAMGDRKKVLMLVNRETGASWKVLDFEASTGRTKLEGTNGMQISPIPKERENDLYYPMWR